jgi:hypothetical protein
MSTIEAYCPGCDKVHSLLPMVGSGDGRYRCDARGSFVLYPCGYVGCRRYPTGACGCIENNCPTFGHNGVECSLCHLPILVHSYDVLMPRFTRRMLYEAREGAGGREEDWNRFALTFPQLFREIVAESNAANALALDSHLPPVLINIVNEYLTYPYG